MISTPLTNAVPTSSDPDLGKYLIVGETLQWSDKPQFRWGREMRRFAPMLLFVLLIFTFFLANLLHQREKSLEPATVENASPPPVAPSQPEGKTHVVFAVIVSAFAALLLGFWCYTMFRVLGGQNLLNLFSLSKTCYGLTESRLIVASGNKDFRVLSCHLRQLREIRLHEDRDGFGTIQFGPQESTSDPFRRDEWPRLMLKNVPRAAEVFKLIVTHQAKLLKE